MRAEEKLRYGVRYYDEGSASPTTRSKSVAGRRCRPTTGPPTSSCATTPLRADVVDPDRERKTEAARKRPSRRPTNSSSERNWTAKGEERRRVVHPRRLLDPHERFVMEDAAQYMTAPTSKGDKPLPRRAGTRSMLPSTWVSRSLRVEVVAQHRLAR
jgi:hypothetical protein